MRMFEHVQVVKSHTAHTDQGGHILFLNIYIKIFFN